MRYFFGRSVVFLGVCLAGFLTAASASDSGSQSQVAAVVKMHFHSFDPKTVTINAGQTVRWENKAFLVWHTVTADPALAKKAQDVALPPGAQPFNSGKIKSGGSYEHTFTVPGTYRYFCQPHESKGMVGEVVVK